MLDIGTAIENLDEAAIAAMEAQFPGFKSAIECLKGGPEGSPVREAAGEGAKAQITTPATRNEATLRSISGEYFDGAYPHVFVDPEDPESFYAVYPQSSAGLFIRKFDGGRESGSIDELELQGIYPDIKFEELPKKTRYERPVAVDAGEPEQPIPESSDS